LRLFIGIELDDRLRASVNAISERLRERLKRSRLGLDARWVARENLHVTLWFIGEANDERAAAIRTAIGAPFATAAFDLRLAGCGAFPASGPPRVLWIGVSRGADALAAIYGEVGARLVPQGYEPERRPYSAHLTIARVKDMPRGSSGAVRAALAEIPADAGGCRIETVTLFRSHLSPKGSVYEPLVRVPLRA
jgi:2'-5' RNA ligase